MFNGAIRDAERNFARALWDENIRLKRALADSERSRNEYLADVKVWRGALVFYDPTEYPQRKCDKKESAASDTPIPEAAEI